MFDEHLVPHLGSNMGKTIGGQGLDAFLYCPFSMRASHVWRWPSVTVPEGAS